MNHRAGIDDGEGEPLDVPALHECAGGAVDSRGVRQGLDCESSLAAAERKEGEWHPEEGAEHPLGRQTGVVGRHGGAGKANGIHQTSL
jgi:hypothetical protein